VCVCVCVCVFGSSLMKSEYFSKKELKGGKLRLRGYLRPLLIQDTLFSRPLPVHQTDGLLEHSLFP